MKKSPSPCIDVCKFKLAGHGIGCSMTGARKKAFGHGAVRPLDRIAFILAVLSLGAAAPVLDAAERPPAEAARVQAVTAPTTDFTRAERFENRPGGAATNLTRLDRDAFSQVSANASNKAELRFKVGNGLFRKLWVSAPASTQASDGLGPLYNARACQRCHIKDGRGHPPERPEDDGVSMLLRLSVPRDVSTLEGELLAYLSEAPEPTYGLQLQDRSVAGVAAEGRIGVSWEEIPVALSGGETASLREPAWRVDAPAYGPLHPDTRLSPRVAQPMIGLGLLEAVPEAEILAHADPEDADGDGLSGRPNRVWSREADAWMLGRFGWKAGEPSVREQSADAFAGDMGLSTSLNPVHSADCTAAQPECLAAPNGASPQYDDLEVHDEALDLVAFYARNLAVPARRDVDDPQVLRGKAMFYESGCTGCHTPKFVTARETIDPEHAFQLIWPYSDMLLHDMGAGLADNRGEWAATGREWRTVPLWGIGLTEAVGGHSYFLHDGRARSLLEAILWHGGEAGAAAEAVRTMTPADRAALIRFLESL